MDTQKDAVKSGGEWIPTSVLEAVISEQPAVAAVAMIAQPHQRWGERPLAILQPGASVTQGDILGHLEEAVRAGRIAKFWVPDRVVIVEELPLTSAGKINKALLRSRFGSAS